MAGNQQARIVDTIVELKRAFSSRSDDSDGEDPIDRPSNRGNKLMLHAKYVQEGRLSSGPSMYKKRIEHAGYQRDIIYRNPRRFDEDGDLIVIDEPDDEADLSPAEDNIYGEIRLEETLAPLTAAPDLPNHPSLSTPYNSRYLDEMIAKISETLRREQQNLAKMKKLLTTLRGDADFAPCGTMETDYDAILGRGQGLGPMSVPAMSTASSIVDMQSLVQGSAITEAATNGTATASMTNGAGVTAPETAVVDTASVSLNGATHVAEADNTLSTSTTRDENIGGPVQAIPTTETDAKTDGTGDADVSMTNGQVSESAEQAAEGEGDDDDADSQPISHRMTTRAQANKTTGEMSTDTASLVDSVPPIHPYFMFPASATGDTQMGLPLKEAEEAKGYFAHYVAKQEEVVLNLKQLEGGLLEAQRKRKMVMKWCKAEGHVGEMSDGEDWYDIDEWNLEAPLKKGDEEVEEDVGISGKKTRGRRERAAN